MFANLDITRLLASLDISQYEPPIQSREALQLDRLLSGLPLLVSHQLSVICTWKLMSEVVLAAFVSQAIAPVTSNYSEQELAQCLEVFIRNTRWNQIKKKRKTANYVHEFNKLLVSLKFTPIDEDVSRYCWMHQLKISPSDEYLEGPYIDQSNRVVREYSKYMAHFLQVAFVGLDGSQIGQHMFFADNEQYGEYHFEGKIHYHLSNGVTVSGRLFKFLAFSSSSLKEGRFLFFHEPKDGSNITVDSIREWMGDFSMIKNPARYSARLAQALTSTTPTIEIQPHEVEMHTPDVERNGYVFSDGIGTISPDLADAIWTSFKNKKPPNSTFQSASKNISPVPSAFQIRFGGAKGMLSVDPSLSGRIMRIRQSMIKFDSPNCQFIEIADYSSSSRVAFLNRQVILILEGLGVPKSTFLEIQRDAIKELALLGTSTERVMALANRIGHFGNFARLMDNLKVPRWIENSFVQQSLAYVRAHFLKEIKYRARMKIPDGWTLLGVLDVVFSQHGSRDLPSQLAGGDLDGDMFTVICNASLYPPRFNAPGAYIPPKQPPQVFNVTIEDINDFIVHFLKNNNLGLIARRHMMLADISSTGVFHQDCLKLSEMHSTAVDFAKTGVAVNFRLAPPCRTRPDYLTHPNQKGKQKGVYESQRVMGLLFRDLELNRLIRQSGSQRLIRESVDPLWELALRVSPDWKEEYDAALEYQQRFEEEVFLIASYCDPPLTELELWTGCIDMSERTYHRTAFNLESWALEQFGTLILKIQDEMIEGRSKREIKNLAAANYYVSDTNPEVGNVFGLLLLHHLVESK
ncbi:hypothetical protein HDU79_005847 [Rhizoclosmatium sp. JEL0117]|nr:hypothetical protein HDU79_005847 [Rhizoclosmatium sp. JEL0117]